VDRQRLESELADRYDADEEMRRVVARQAQDLADSGRITEDFGFELTVDDVLANLADGPDDHSLAECWNWWMGSLDLSHGGYDRFHVRTDLE
jgi:hypothetical protein